MYNSDTSSLLSPITNKNKQIFVQAFSIKLSWNRK